ncbi:MAG: hypothetical protein ACC608_02330 [Anaerofustis sp.]
MNGILYFIVLGVAIGSVIGIIGGFMKFRSNEKIKYVAGPLAEASREHDLKRNQIKAMYPSNMSWRGFITDTKNTYQENQIAYMIAEGDSLFFVYDEDMQTKFQIPIANIISFEKIKLSDLAGVAGLKVPAVEPSPYLPVFLILYKNNENEQSSLYFFYESLDSGSLYNKSIPGQESLFFYVKSYRRNHKQ